MYLFLASCIERLIFAFHLLSMTYIVILSDTFFLSLSYFVSPEFWKQTSGCFLITLYKLALISDAKLSVKKTLIYCMYCRLQINVSVLFHLCGCWKITKVLFTKSWLQWRNTWILTSYSKKGIGKYIGHRTAENIGINQCH